MIAGFDNLAGASFVQVSSGTTKLTADEIKTRVLGNLETHETQAGAELKVDDGSIDVLETQSSDEALTDAFIDWLDDTVGQELIAAETDANVGTGGDEIIQREEFERAISEAGLSDEEAELVRVALIGPNPIKTGGEVIVFEKGTLGLARESTALGKDSTVELAADLVFGSDTITAGTTITLTGDTDDVLITDDAQDNVSYYGIPAGTEISNGGKTYTLTETLEVPAQQVTVVQPQGSSPPTPVAVIDDTVVAETIRSEDTSGSSTTEIAQFLRGYDESTMTAGSTELSDFADETAKAMVEMADELQLLGTAASALNEALLLLKNENDSGTTSEEKAVITAAELDAVVSDIVATYPTSGARIRRVLMEHINLAEEDEAPPAGQIVPIGYSGTDLEERYETPLTEYATDGSRIRNGSSQSELASRVDFYDQTFDGAIYRTFRDDNSGDDQASGSFAREYGGVVSFTSGTQIDTSAAPAFTDRGLKVYQGTSYVAVSGTDLPAGIPTDADLDDPAKWTPVTSYIYVDSGGYISHANRVDNGLPI